MSTQNTSSSNNTVDTLPGALCLFTDNNSKTVCVIRSTENIVNYEMSLGKPNSNCSKKYTTNAVDIGSSLNKAASYFKPLPACVPNGDGYGFTCKFTQGGIFAPSSITCEARSQMNTTLINKMINDDNTGAKSPSATKSNVFDKIGAVAGVFTLAAPVGFKVYHIGKGISELAGNTAANDAGQEAIAAGEDAAIDTGIDVAAT